MLTDVILILAGLMSLFWGGEWLIKASSRLATSFGIPVLIIGLTVVALGTSMPELVVSITAALDGSSTLSLGNVVGSNIANVGLIMGASGLIFPVVIHVSLIRREIPVMIVASILVLVMALDGGISRIEGLLLMAGYPGFVVMLYRTGSAEKREVEILNEEIDALDGEPAVIHRRTELVRIVVGLVLLVIGAQLTVSGAVNLAKALGISELLIGLTLVAVGTSLPELATSVIAALRGHSDIVAGNVIGSSIANLLVILGAAAAVNPVQVDPGLISFELPVMLLFALLLIPFSLRQVLGRFPALLYLLLYISFLALTVFRSGIEAVG